MAASTKTGTTRTKTRTPSASAASAASAASSKKAPSLRRPVPAVDPMATLADPGATWTEQILRGHVERDPRHAKKLLALHEDDPFVEHVIELGRTTTVELVTPSPGNSSAVPVLVQTTAEQRLVIDTVGSVSTRETTTARSVFWRDGYGLGWAMALDPEELSGITPMGDPVPIMAFQPREDGVTALFDAELGRRKAAGTASPMHKHFAQVEKDFLEGTMRHWGDSVDTSLIYRLGDAALRSKDPAGLALCLVGAENVRTDVVKALSTAPLGWIVTAFELWDQSMPVDWFVAFLHNAGRLADQSRKRRAEAEKLQEECRRITIHRYETPETMPLWDRIAELNQHTFTSAPFGSEIRSPQWVRTLDGPTRARLLRKQLSDKDVRHIRDIKQLSSKTYHRIALRPFLNQIDPVTSARNWADLEYQLNARHARLEDLHKTAEKEREQRETTLRAQWLDTEAGAAWLTRRDAQQQAAERARAQATEKMLAKLEKQQKTAFQAWERIGGHLARISAEHRDGFTYEVATSQAQLNAWSRLMNNCIAGYNPDPAKSGSMLLGVHHDSRLVANAEITLPRNEGEAPMLRQLEGRRGGVLTDALREQVLEHVREAEVSISARILAR